MHIGVTVCIPMHCVRSFLRGYVGLAALLLLRRLVTAPQNAVRGTNSSDEPVIGPVGRGGSLWSKAAARSWVVGFPKPGWPQAYTNFRYEPKSVAAHPLGMRRQEPPAEPAERYGVTWTR